MDIDFVEDMPCKIIISRPLARHVVTTSHLMDWMIENAGDMFMLTECSFVGRAINVEALTYFAPEIHIDTIIDCYFRSLLANKKSKQQIKKKTPVTLTASDIVWCLEDSVVDHEQAKDSVNKKTFTKIIKAKLAGPSAVYNYAVMINATRTHVDPSSLKYQWCIINMYKIARMSPVFNVCGGVEFDGDNVVAIMNGIGEAICNFDLVASSVAEQRDFAIELFLALSLLERDGLSLSIDVAANPYMLTFQWAPKPRVYIVDQQTLLIKSKWRPSLSVPFSLSQGESKAKDMMEALQYKVPTEQDMSATYIGVSDLNGIKNEDVELYYLLSDLTLLTVYPIHIKPSEQTIYQIKQLNKVKMENTLPYRLLCDGDFVYDVEEDEPIDDKILIEFMYNNNYINLAFTKLSLAYTWNHGPKAETDKFFFARD